MALDDNSFGDQITVRPTVVDVDLDALEHNFRVIAESVAPAEVMPIVKANAYGHGLIPCAQLLEELGAKSFGVAFLEEGVQLRKAGIEVPILVFGGVFGAQIRHFVEYDLELTASSIEKLQSIDDTAGALQKKAKVHLKIDTGMERIGVHYYSAEKLFEKTLSCKNTEVVGVFSHFAASDDRDLSFTKLQLERFEETLQFFEKRSLPMPKRHIANSGAIMQFPESHLDLVRPGVCLYGVSPSEPLNAKLDLKPVLSLRSTIVYFKVVKKDAGVSYGLTWSAPEDTRIVTVPLGYGDGYFRKLSNCGEVLVNGKRYPIVGRVCMDQIMVNIGQDSAYNGDEVVLIGEQGAERITVEEIAKLVGTDNPREVLLSTNQRVPRRYHRRGSTSIE